MFMRLKGEAYSRRLESYFDSTLQLMSDIKSLSKEKVLKAADITTNSELTEEQVVAELLKLKEGK
jgi:hypothetical protein